MGWDGMVIIDYRYFKSTFGANKGKGPKNHDDAIDEGDTKNLVARINT